MGLRDTYDGFAIIEKTPQNGELRRFQTGQSHATRDVFEEFHYDNGKLFEFVPASKMVRQHLMPKEKFAGQQGSLLSLLFDMGIQQAKARYRLEVKDANPPDAHYDYIQIEPRQAADKSEFARARLALYRSNKLPAGSVRAAERQRNHLEFFELANQRASHRQIFRTGETLSVGVAPGLAFGAGQGGAVNLILPARSLA